MAQAKQKAQGIIDSNPAVVFSKSYCPYCRATKSLLTEMGAKYELVELDEISDGAALQDALQEITGQRTVPNVFIGKEHVGGNSEVQGKGRSALEKMLRDAGAL